jgi:hypothetical protein
MWVGTYHPPFSRRRPCAFGEPRDCRRPSVSAGNSSHSRQALNAERVEHWGARHPEEWALWYQLASTGLEDPRIVQIQITIKKDPEAVRVEKEAWLEAAQRLEEALSASAHEPH